MRLPLAPLLAPRGGRNLERSLSSSSGVVQRGHPRRAGIVRNPKGIAGDDADAPGIDQIGIDYRRKALRIGYQIGLLVAVHLGLGRRKGKNGCTDWP
jgi:hypothetical protein